MNFINWLRESFGSSPAPLSPQSTRAERGRYGEDLAASYCREELSYRVITRNWRYKRDEIDMICQDGEVLVFIEVRTRAATALVSGFHSVDAKKKKVLQRGCRAYFKQLQNPPKHFRFDVIDILLDEAGQGHVRHYANVALFPKHYITKA